MAKHPFNWDVVSLACQMMGAYLLSIHSREELNFVKERLRRVRLFTFLVLKSHRVDLLIRRFPFALM